MKAAIIEIVKLDSEVLTAFSCPSDCLTDGGSVCGGDD